MAVYEIDWQSNQQSDVAKMKCIIMKGAILDWLSSVYMSSSNSPWLSMDLHRMNKKYTNGNLFNGKWFKTVRNHFWGEFFVL